MISGFYTFLREQAQVDFIHLLHLILVIFSVLITNIIVKYPTNTG